MIKLPFTKTGLRLLKGLCLFIFAFFPGVRLFGGLISFGSLEQSSRDVVTVLKLEGPNYNGPLSLLKNGGAQVYFYLIKSQKIGGARAPLAR